MKTNTSRFDGRSENYVNFRPSYPVEVIDAILSTCSLDHGSAVADMGSGTGTFSELLVKHGLDVYGVEPTVEMREAAERSLSGSAHFHSVAGSAENTTLDDASFHLVTAAQSFHWFQPGRTKVEMRRILRPGGWVALIWNQRDIRTQIQQEYDSLLRTFVPDYDDLVHTRINDDVISDFFSASLVTRSFTIQQLLDFDGLMGRMKSSSYVPDSDQPVFAQMANELAGIFDKHQANGEVPFDYETRLFVGQLSG